MRNLPTNATDSLVTQGRSGLRLHAEFHGTQHEDRMNQENQVSYTPGGQALDAAVFGFAAFTLLCHVAVGLELGLDQLIQLTLLAGLVALGIGIWRRRKEHQPPQPEAKPSDSTSRAGRLEVQLGLLGLAVLGTGLHAWTGSLWGYWLCAGAATLIALGREARTDPLAPQVPILGWERASLFGLGLLCAGAALLAHHGDADDAFYVNLSVWALDHPQAPLLLGDTLHGFEGIPMSLPVFKLLSYEIGQAAIARLSGVPAITVVHLWLPPLIAFLIPFAWARLARLLVPSRWFLVLVLIIAQLFFLGDGHASYGDFGLLRLQQGKTVLLLIALPLIASYGIRFGLEPGLGRGAMLMASQIAAVGLSTTALWLAPVTALLAVCSAVPMRGSNLSRAWRPITLGLLTALYPLALALFMRSETLRAFTEAVNPLASLEWSSPQLMTHALSILAGSGPIAGLTLFCLLAVLALPGTSLFRRYVALSCGAFFLFFFDPWLARFVSQQVTGADTYFRVFWILPVPLIVASVLSAPLTMVESLTIPQRRGWTALILAGALALLIGLPNIHTLSSQNQVRIDWPGPKVPTQEWAAAQRIAETSQPGDFILAPPPVSRWIPLFQDHPAPLMVRAMHLDRLHDRLGADELRKRRLLTQLVGGLHRSSDGPGMLEEAIGRYPLNAVLLSGPALTNPELRRVLLASPLSVGFRDADLELWVRESDPDSSEH